MGKEKKKKKLDSISKINRRLFKIWSEVVRERAGEKCEYCGIKSGDINSNGKKTKIDAHHLVSRNIHNCPLKFDIRNGVAVCPSCHKFSPDNSFHRNPVVTIGWMAENHPERVRFVVQNFKARVNLNNREVLAEIEKQLKMKEPLNLEKLLEMDKMLSEQKSEMAVKETESDKNQARNRQDLLDFPGSH